jgi:hypothetical protein
MWHYEAEERCIEGIVGKSQGKKSHGRPRRRWEDNIKINLAQNRMGAWIELVWLRIRKYGGLL